MVAVYDQNYLFDGFNGMKVDDPLNLFQFKMWRNSLEFEELPFGEDIDNIASMSNNGNKYWYSEYAHRIGYLGEPWVGILVSDFKDYMTHIENTYGRYGSDRVWVAGVQEVYEYFTIRENAYVVATEITGNQLQIELDLSDVPDNLRRNALTLLVNGNSNLNITNVTTTNANVTYNTNGLINLDW